MWWWGFLLTCAGEKGPSGATSRATSPATLRLQGRRKQQNLLPAIRQHHIRMDTSADGFAPDQYDATALATRRLTLRAYADHIAQP